MKILLLVVLLGSGLANDDVTSKYVEEYFLYKDAIKFVRGCGAKNLSLCVKERALRLIENLPNNTDLGGGLTIKQIEDSQIPTHRGSFTLSHEPKAREEALDQLLTQRLSDYLRSHSFEFRFPLNAMNDLDKSVEEGRKKKRGGLRLRSMMMFLQMKAALIGALALNFIGMVAFKALLIAKIALTIASVIALKKIVETKHHSSTYEVVAHPHYDDHSHYDRSFTPDLAYHAYEGGRIIA